MNPINPADLDVASAGVCLRDGHLSALELAKAHLARIDAIDPLIRAFVARDDDVVLNAARRADAELAAGMDRGPLHGIPVAVKDLIDTVDFPTQYGSALFRDHRPNSDAACVQRLKEAGAVILGKLATYEFATVGPSFDTPFSPPRNPWDIERITGGSSSGSAAAVAARLVRIAIGTDTGGSVRSPASYCGIAGFKPSFGAIKVEGVFPLAPSLDHVGVLAASAAEAGLAMAALGGMEHAPSDKKDLAGLTIGYARSWFASDPQIEPGVLATIDAAASLMSLLGARVIEIEMPAYSQFEAAGAALLHAEAFALHRERLADRTGDFGIKTFRTLIAGACLGPDDVALAKRASMRLRQTLENEVFTKCQAVIGPTTLTSAPELAAFKGDDAVWTPMRTIAFNVTGHPAISIPAGFAGRMPVGLQIAGPMGTERLLCRIAEAFEGASDFSVQRSPHAGCGN